MPPCEEGERDDEHVNGDEHNVRMDATKKSVHGYQVVQNSAADVTWVFTVH